MPLAISINKAKINNKKYGNTGMGRNKQRTHKRSHVVWYTHAYTSPQHARVLFALLERERARKRERGMTTSIAGCLVEVRRDHGSRRPLSCCQRTCSTTASHSCTRIAKARCAAACAASHLACVCLSAASVPQRPSTIARASGPCSSPSSSMCRSR